MTVQNVKPPTYMRYARVEQVLSQELAFRDRLSPKSEAVLKPDGESQLFAPEVIAITQLIHNDGKDAHKCQKLDVIRAAVDVFKNGKIVPAAPPQMVTPAEPEQPPQAPAPPVAKAPASKPEKAAKPTPAPKAAPKPKAKAAPVQAAPEPPPAQETKKLEATSDKTPEVKPDVKRDEVVKVAKEVLTQDTNQATVNPYISVYSLVISALQNCELFDDQPGKDKRLKSLDEIANEFLRLAKSFKGAKETQKN